MTPGRFAVLLAVAASLLGLCSSSALAAPRADEATKVYLKQFQPAYARFLKVGTSIDRAVDKAAKRGDRDNAQRFALLGKRTETAGTRLDRIEPPNSFATPHRALVRSIKRLATDLATVSRAARKHDKTAATAAGFRLGKTVKALKKAEAALDLALSRATAPGDAASL